MELDRFKFNVEARVYGVCERIGERLNMPVKSIRLFFIYASCLTIGSPVIVYMILAFWIRMKDEINRRRNPIWDF